MESSVFVQERLLTLIFLFTFCTFCIILIVCCQFSKSQPKHFPATKKKTSRQESLECPICINTFTAPCLFYHCSSNHTHSVCSNCLNDYIHLQLTNKSKISLKCWTPGCKGAYCENSLRKVLGKKRYASYVQMLTAMFFFFLLSLSVCVCLVTSVEGASVVGEDWLITSCGVFWNIALFFGQW